MLDYVSKRTAPAVHRSTIDRIVNILRWEIIERLRLHGLTFLRDALVVAIAFAAAETVRFSGQIPPHYLLYLPLALPLTAFIYCVFGYQQGIHRRLWKYAGMADVRAVMNASLFSVAVITIMDLVLAHHRFFPISVILIGGVFAIAGLLGVRLGSRLVHSKSETTVTKNRVLIVGAGHAGHLVAADLLAHGDDQHVVGFLDDNLVMHRRTISGIPVLNSIDRLPQIVRALAVDTIAVAIPSATTRELDRILALAQDTDARIQVLSSQAEVLSGRSPAAHLQDIDLDRLLDRIPSSEGLQGPLVRDCVAGKVVLVTGGAGSIGSELCRQLVTLNPTMVLALDNNETGLFHLQRELEGTPGAALLKPILTSVTAGPKLDRVFAHYKPDIVFHAAAYKHVPMLELHVDEAVFVNVKGTWNVCAAAAKHGCERVVFISTDKAVDPVNTLGFSKRIGEFLIQAHHGTSNTIFCAVRFGNVIGSRGSALPEFLRQIDEGGPVTVTHPDVERYFMTIPEAVSLVIQAGAHADGGEIFMLDMGQPIKIGDLVKRLIRLRGLRVGKDIEIVYTGLRPGEKLTEDLVFKSERTRPTGIPSVHALVDPGHVDLHELLGAITHLMEVAVEVAVQDHAESVLVEGLYTISSGNFADQGWKSAAGALSRRLHRVTKRSGEAELAQIDILAARLEGFERYSPGWRAIVSGRWDGVERRKGDRRERAENSSRRGMDRRRNPGRRATDLPQVEIDLPA